MIKKIAHCVTTVWEHFPFTVRLLLFLAFCLSVCIMLLLTGMALCASYLHKNPVFWSLAVSGALLCGSFVFLNAARFCLVNEQKKYIEQLKLYIVELEKAEKSLLH